MTLKKNKKLSSLAAGRVLDSSVVAKRICLSEVSLLSFKSLLTTEFPGLDLQFHYDGPDSIASGIDRRWLIILH